MNKQQPQPSTSITTEHNKHATFILQNKNTSFHNLSTFRNQLNQTQPLIHPTPVFNPCKSTPILNFPPDQNKYNSSYNTKSKKVITFKSPTKFRTCRTQLKKISNLKMQKYKPIRISNSTS